MQPNITLSSKLYSLLCVSFSCLVVLANLTYQKFVHFNIFSYGFELSAAAMLYPLTFLVTDLIAEFYGKNSASFCVKLGIFSNILAVGIISIMDLLPATSWSKISSEDFHNIFGSYGFAFFASLCACLISQTADIYIYLAIKRITKDKFLWIRNLVSTSVSLLIDTSVVVSLMFLFGYFTKEQVLPLIFSSYSFKIIATICNVPLFYFLASKFRGFLDY